MGNSFLFARTGFFIRQFRKELTICSFVVKCTRYAKTIRKPSSFGQLSEKRTVGALCVPVLPATFVVAWDDRDGRSRYRASEISCFGGIIRVVPRLILAPMFGGGVYILYSILEVIQ